MSVSQISGGVDMRDGLCCDRLKRPNTSEWSGEITTGNVWVGAAIPSGGMEGWRLLEI